MRATGFVLFMWISFYVFLLPFVIILSAKLVQYFRRWGESKSTNLEYTTELLNLSLEKSDLSIPSTVVKPKTSSRLKKILLITPYTISTKRYLYLATALALNMYEITLIESKISLTKVRKESINPQLLALELLKIVSPDIVIASDLSFPVFIKELQRSSEIKFIFLRPVFTRTQKSRPISLFFSIPLISNLLVTTIKLDQKEYSSIASDVLCIFPRMLLMKPQVTKIYKNLTLHYIRSRISFRDKETIVFACIVRFIEEGVFS
jgi:hypothetical protein